MSIGPRCLPAWLAISLLLGLLGSPSAWAAATCWVSSTPLSFGSYDRMDILPNDSQATVTLSCQEDAFVGLGEVVNYTISLDTGASASFSPRTMQNGPHNLNYNLYTDPTRLLIWGDGTGGTNTVQGSLAVPLCIIIVGCAIVTAEPSVYGRIPTAQNVAAGSYSDTITVTVSY